MKKVITLVFVFILFIIPTSIVAQQSISTSWANLDEISSYAWQLSKQKRFEESKQLLEYFDEKFKEVPLTDSDMSVDELHVISSSHQKALDTLIEKKASDEEKMKAVTQFRLVVDAIVSEHQPLWGTMEEPIMTTFSQLKSNMEEGNQEAFQHEWNKFLSLYNLIYPSLVIDVKEQNIKRVETHISAIEENMFLEVSSHTRLQQLIAMEEALQDIFDNSEEDDTDPSLLWVIITTGSIILLTLTYTGWKKYKGEKTFKIKKREQEK